MSIWKHAEKWGAPSEDAAVTLSEGNTPPIRSTRIGAELGAEESLV